MPALHTVLFTRESQYLTGLIVCELAQAAHLETMPENPGTHKNQPARLPGTRVLAQSAKTGPTLAFPLDDKGSQKKLWGNVA